MKKYIGTKIVEAQLMTVAEAEEILGKQIDLSKHEGETDGYLLVYPDGYKSFSPKSVFEESYRLADTFVDRLKVERGDLGDKMEKLYDFIHSEAFKELAFNKQADLNEQYAVMLAYFNILNRRITDAVGETPAGTDHLRFSEVIEGLKQGRCYRRSGWNGKGMFICKQIPATLEGMVIPKLQNLPQSAKDILLAREGTPKISYTNQMLIIHPDGRADSWVPSVSDVFAEDWEIVSE